MIDHIFTFLMLVMLQAVLGLDNLLYISLESKNAPEDKQAYTRKIGIAGAIILRIVLLFVLVKIITYLQTPFLNFQNGIFDMKMNGHSLIVLVGGVFIIYTAIKEIWHMMAIHQDSHKEKKKKSVKQVITMIIIMNLVFSFDSILSAMALSDNLIIMASAIVASGLLMIYLSDKVSTFLQKNRMYEVLGLFILFIVGIMLVSEGGHLAHIKLIGNEITPMSKTTFYFVLFVLILIDIIQSKYQKNILLQQEKAEKKGKH